MKVYPNPYGHLDHAGRLAGACPMEPTHRAGARAFVCASLSLLNGKELDDDKALKDDLETRGQRERHGFTFAVEPMLISADPGWYYASRARSGEVFTPRDGKPPIAQWAAARTKAALEWAAQHNEPPPFHTWQEQWQLDKDVAAFLASKTEKGAR